MKLHRDWKKILKNSWNVRIVAAAVVLSGVEAFVPFLPALMSVPPGVMAALTPITLMAALVARLIAQKTISGEDHADQQDRIDEARESRGRGRYARRFRKWLDRLLGRTS